MRNSAEEFERGYVAQKLENAERGVSRLRGVVARAHESLSRSTASHSDTCLCFACQDREETASILAESSR